MENDLEEVVRVMNVYWRWLEDITDEVRVMKAAVWTSKILELELFPFSRARDDGGVEKEGGRLAIDHASPGGWGGCPWSAVTAPRRNLEGDYELGYDVFKILRELIECCTAENRFVFFAGFVGVFMCFSFLFKWMSARGTGGAGGGRMKRR